MTKYCHHCNSEIEHLLYSANYSETIYGRSWGTADLYGDIISCDDSESQDSDNWDEYDVEYECPECNAAIYIEELLDESDENNEDYIDNISVDTADDFNKNNFKLL